MSFIQCFARKSKISTEWTRTPLRELTIKKKTKFSTSEFAEFTEICHFEITKQNIATSPDFSPGGEENTPHLNIPPCGASPPSTLNLPLLLCDVS